MKYTVVVRAKLKSDRQAMKQYHDDVTKATRAQAQQAGDLTHRVFQDPKDPAAFLGIDEWSSLEGIQKFSSSPQIQEFFGKLFAGPPEVTVWVDSDWNQW